MHEKVSTLGRHFADGASMLKGLTALGAAMSSVNQDFTPAGILFASTLVIDKVDGMISRKFNLTDKSYGVKIDLLSDAIMWTAIVGSVFIYFDDKSGDIYTSGLAAAGILAIAAYRTFVAYSADLI